MERLRIHGLLVVSLAVVACGSRGNGGSDSSADANASTSGGAAGGAGAPPAGPGGADPTATNVVSVTVDTGPSGTDSVDVPFARVTVCAPGTTQCQTIDYVSVDTGSSGLRIVASVLPSSLSLPQRNAATGDPLVECAQFGDGYSWGSVRLADIHIAGETAENVPIQLIGDPAFAAVPSDCSSSGPAEDTVAAFGANGLLGINQIVADCGAICADTARIEPGTYYSCRGSSCTPVAVAVADQVSNPIASFSADDNGAVLDFPAVPAGGAPTLSGSLIFGIGTQANNGLGNATVQTVDANGEFTTVYKGTTFAHSFVDSGTNALGFEDRAIAACTASALHGLYCPTSTLSLTARNVGLNGVPSTVPFNVASPLTLFGHGAYSVFDDLAGDGIDSTSFDWGFPFFIGRRIYFALDGAPTPGPKGPYVAY